ncbi:DUF6069 family protein [Micromonospora sp. BQ11]|uniref:DUF6069 family protein n=1 Tax=Micromonospora sp. BQ11 TaxID=3452212 RepID=UPI003F8946D2
MTNLLLRRSAVTVGATVLAAAVFAVLTEVADIDLAARAGDSTRHVTVAATVTAAIVAAAAGWALLAVLERRTARARGVWTAVAVVVLLLSLLAGPATGIGAAAKLGLTLLHVSVGAVLILGLPRRGPGR